MKPTTVYLPVVTLSGMRGVMRENNDGSASWWGLPPYEAYLMCDPAGIASLDKWMQKVNRLGWDADEYAAS